MLPYMFHIRDTFCVAFSFLQCQSSTSLLSRVVVGEGGALYIASKEVSSSFFPLVLWQNVPVFLGSLGLVENYCC